MLSSITMKRIQALTPADLGILAAAIDNAAHLGGDDAVEEIALVVEYEIGFSDQGEARELAYDIVHRMKRRLP